MNKTLFLTLNRQRRSVISRARKSVISNYSVISIRWVLTVDFDMSFDNKFH